MYTYLIGAIALVSIAINVYCSVVICHQSIRIGELEYDRDHQGHPLDSQGRDGFD